MNGNQEGVNSGNTPEYVGMIDKIRIGYNMTKTIWRKLDRRIETIWADTPEYCAGQEKNGTWKERLGKYCRAHRTELLFVLLMGCFLCGLSWILPFDQGPDEKMRYMIPTYIYRHGTLPAGYDPEVTSRIWGISYAYQPILPYIFGGYLMKLVGLFTTGDKALLMAARFINVLIGMGFYWYVLQISKKLFHRGIFRVFFVALLAMLPQLLYLFVYVNTDGIAMLSSAMLICYWLEGLEHHWDRRSCTRLAVGVSVCALSYFNAYGYALFSIVLFVVSLAVRYMKRGLKACMQIILKRGIYITVLVFLLAGWWFIQCAILYDGDFLGMKVQDHYAEMYAQEDFKPSVKKSLYQQGVPLAQMLANEEEGGMEWIRTTWRSFIGYFGYYKYALGLDIYEIHKRLSALGAVGLFLKILVHCLEYAMGSLIPLLKKMGIWKQEKAGISGRKSVKWYAAAGTVGEKMHPMEFFVLQFSFVCCIIIPVLLSLYYSYMSDFQPQGRYIMPMVIPLMYFVTVGIERFVTLFFGKWMQYVMMVPLFYAVLHVFLGAFISVYIPTYYEPLASWADIRFVWFSNLRVFTRLIQMLFPG